MLVEKRTQEASYIDKILAKNLRRLRKARKWKQADLASRYGHNGCDQGYISQLECGRRGFGVDTLDGLAGAFGVSVEKISEMLMGIDKDVTDKWTELRIRKELMDKVMEILLNGPMESVAALETIISLLEKKRKGGEEVTFPSKEN